MQRSVATCRYGDTGTLLGEQPGDRIAEALRAAVDDRHLAGEPKVHQRRNPANSVSALR
jgi:hypothetical protein